MNIFKKIEMELLTSLDTVPIMRKVYELPDKIIVANITDSEMKNSVIVYNIMVIDSYKSNLDIDASYDILFFKLYGQYTYFTTNFKDINMMFHNKIDDIRYRISYIQKNSYDNKDNSKQFNICNWYDKQANISINIEFWNSNTTYIDYSYDSHNCAKHVRLTPRLYVNGKICVLSLKNLWQIVKRIDKLKDIRKLILLMYKKPLTISDENKKFLLKYVGEECEYLFSPIFNIGKNYIAFKYFGAFRYNNNSWWNNNVISQILSPRHYKEKPDLFAIHYDVKNDIIQAYMEYFAFHLEHGMHEFKEVHCIDCGNITVVYSDKTCMGAYYRYENFPEVLLSVSEIENWIDTKVQEVVSETRNKIQMLMRMGNHTLLEVVRLIERDVKNGN